MREDIPAANESVTSDYMTMSLAVSECLEEILPDLSADSLLANQVRNLVRKSLKEKGKLRWSMHGALVDTDDIGLIRNLVVGIIDERDMHSVPDGWLPIKELSEISNKPSVVSRILETLVGTKADEPGFIGSYKNVGDTGKSRVYVSPELFGYVQDAVALQDGLLKPKYEHAMVSIVEALDHKIPYVLSLIDAVVEEGGFLASEIEYVDDGNGRRVLSVSNLVLNELKVRAKRPPQPGAPEKKGFV